MTQLRQPRFFARITVLAVLVLASAVAAFGIGSGGARRVHAQAQQNAACIPAPIESGETDADALTARIVVSPTEAMTITGTVDATGCGIGVYVARGARVTITNATIYSTELGTAFGVYNDGGQVTIEHSTVQDIAGNGESCGDDETDDSGCGGGTGGGGMGGNGDDRSYTGGRHGTAILFVGPGAQGTISTTTVTNYGRRGISVSGKGAWANIVSNRIIAPTDNTSWLNGVWIANGARAVIKDNTISGNVTRGNSGKSSSAIMIAGGASHNGMPHYTSGVRISANTLSNNDTGVMLSNVGLDGTTKAPPTNATRNFVTGNTISTTNVVDSNDAGINDAGGKDDQIVGNTISGYVISSTVDRSIVISPLSINTVVAGNTIE